MGTLQKFRLAPNAPQAGVIVPLQGLRFLAALLVLLSHLGSRLEAFAERYGVVTPTLTFNGQFGVQIFFVISGFIMVHIGWGKFGQPNSMRDFFAARISRIVPLYWALTALQVALAAAAGGDPDRTGPLNIVRSLLFIPYLNSKGDHRPVLEQGWTLDFEMFFYVAFGLSLLAPRRLGLALVTAYLTAMAICPGSWGILFDPILLFFVAGMVLGLVRRQIRGALEVRHMVPAMSALILAATFFSVSWLYNVAAVALVAFAVVATDPQPGRKIDRVWTALGDSSYALYLSHGFVLLFVGIVWRKLFGADFLAAYAAVIIVGSVAAGWACHCWIERPLNEQARRLFGLYLLKKSRPLKTSEPQP